MFESSFQQAPRSFKVQFHGYRRRPRSAIQFRLNARSLSIDARLGCLVQESYLNCVGEFVLIQPRLIPVGCHPVIEEQVGAGPHILVDL